VGDALESALSQTYRDQEIIVVDDASSDDTAAVVARFNSPKIRYIRHERNLGVAGAGNTGFKSAHGEVIALLDSDDLWKADKLERQVFFLQRHPEVDLVFCDVEIADGPRRLPSTMGFMHRFSQMLAKLPANEEYVLAARDMYLCLLQEVPIKTNAVLLRKACLAPVGYFDETSRSGEDWDLFLRLSRAAKFGYIKDALAIQRRLADSTHTRFIEQDKVFLLNRFLSEKTRLNGDPEALAAVRRGINDHFNNLGFQYLYSGRRAKAAGVYWKGFRETSDGAFLLRVAGVCFPLKLRDSIRMIVKGPDQFGPEADNGNKGARGL
jgi:glycosyltransferase involved in cell wall biosynthesis